VVYCLAVCIGAQRVVFLSEVGDVMCSGVYWGAELVC
jgi:hypothetical protein